MLHTIDWNAVLTVIVAIATWLIHHAVRTPKDHERASLLATLANDAAAVVVALSPPNAKWAQLLRDVIARLAQTATGPTANAQVLERAATAALMRAGKRPDNG